METLLRICASGVVGYTAGSPSCNEYTRLKLNPGGPPALRSPQHLHGLPGISPEDLLKVQDSHAMLSNCIQALMVTYASGGHGHLEQPTTAMSWSEPCVQQWLLTASCHCINLPACLYGADWKKSWMMASSLEDLTSLGGVCEHGPQAHQSIRGTRDASGAFASRKTAEYPPLLAESFAEKISPLFSHDNRDLTVPESLQLLPIKSFQDAPFSRQDGGGMPSTADWSSPAMGVEDIFQCIRHEVFQSLLDTGDFRILQKAFHEKQSDPPFPDHMIHRFQSMLHAFLLKHDKSPNWSIPQDQPMHLYILKSLSEIMMDPDVHLFDYLIAGVPTGFQQDIPISNCFPILTDPIDNSHIHLSVHQTNWKSAEDNLDIARELVQAEVDAGWVEKFQGNLGDAQFQWPLGVSIGKLGIALSEHRPPRLVVDSSICGLNSRCAIPEKGTLPSIKDVQRCFPLRQNHKKLACLSLDVKSAHKRIVVRSSERGLLGFTLDNALFFYRVCPFGAVFSASWWSRLSGFLMRLFHRLIYIAHAGMIYVDDMFFMQDANIMPLTASFLSLFCQAIQIPLSWKKCELSSEVKWIGWYINVATGIITLPEDKRIRMLQLMRDLVSHTRASKKQLEQFIGLAMWATSLFPHMRPWLHSMYTDLHSIPATLYSIDPGFWEETIQCLTESLHFKSKPAGTGIPINGKLVEVRHQPVSTLDDVRKCHLSERRIWCRIRDPNSTRRTLSSSSKRVIEIFERWVKFIPSQVSMWPKPNFIGDSAADACASGECCQIGGFISTSFQTRWFSEKFSHTDFQALNIPISTEMQRDIACYETLAQIAILKIASCEFTLGRIPLRVPSVSDNTSAEAGINRVFSTAHPLSLFLEKLSLLASKCCMDLDISHIAGHDNDIADKLSRWDFESPIPYDFSLCDRVRLPLTALWPDLSHPSLHPSSTWIPWSLPS